MELGELKNGDRFILFDKKFTKTDKPSFQEVRAICMDDQGNEHHIKKSTVVRTIDG